MALVCGVVMLAGCGAAQQAAPSPAPTPTSPIKVTPAELAAADPCGLVEAQGFGKGAKVEPGQEFVQCDVTVGKMTAEVGLLAALSNGTRELPAVSGVPIRAAQENNQICQRQIAVAEAVVQVQTTMTNYELSTTAALCKLSDRAVVQVIGRLLRGNLAPAKQPASSLAHKDACALVDEAALSRFSDIDHTVRDRGFNGQYCLWGVRNSDPGGEMPLFSIEFVRGSYPHPANTRDEFISIGGRIVNRWWLLPGMKDIPGCRVDIPQRTNEIVFVRLVTAKVSRRNACEPLTPIATQVIKNLT